MELGRGCWDQVNLGPQEEGAAFAALCPPPAPPPTRGITCCATPPVCPLPSTGPGMWWALDGLNGQMIHQRPRVHKCGHCADSSQLKLCCRWPEPFDSQCPTAWGPHFSPEWWPHSLKFVGKEIRHREAEAVQTRAICTTTRACHLSIQGCAAVRAAIVSRCHWRGDPSRATDGKTTLFSSPSGHF